MLGPRLSLVASSGGSNMRHGGCSIRNSQYKTPRPLVFISGMLYWTNPQLSTNKADQEVPPQWHASVQDCFLILKNFTVRIDDWLVHTLCIWYTWYIKCICFSWLDIMFLISCLSCVHKVNIIFSVSLLPLTNSLAGAEALHNEYVWCRPTSRP